MLTTFSPPKSTLHMPCSAHACIECLCLVCRHRALSKQNERHPEIGWPVLGNGWVNWKGKKSEARAGWGGKGNGEGRGWIENNLLSNKRRQSRENGFLHLVRERKWRSWTENSEVRKGNNVHCPWYEISTHCSQQQLRKDTSSIRLLLFLEKNIKLIYMKYIFCEE